MPIDVKALQAYLIEQFERGNQFFAGGDPRLAIRCYEAALQSFYANQDVPELLSTYQKLWCNKAMAHQQLRQYSQL